MRFFHIHCSMELYSTVDQVKLFHFLGHFFDLSFWPHNIHTRLQPGFCYQRIATCQRLAEESLCVDITDMILTQGGNTARRTSATGRNQVRLRATEEQAILQRLHSVNVSMLFK